MGGEKLKFVKEAFESNYIAPLRPQVDAFERDGICGDKTLPYPFQRDRGYASINADPSSEVKESRFK